MMRDEDKTKAQLIAELASLRRQLASRPGSTPVARGEPAADLSEVRYRQLFESMTSGVVVYEAVEGGQNFLLKDFNRAAEKIEAIKRKEIIGRRVTDVFPGVAEFGLLPLLQRVWHSGQPEYQAASFYRDERIFGWRENYVYKLPSGEIVAIYNDVTERKRAEETLGRSAEVNAAIATLSGFLISLVSLDEISTLVLAQARRFTDSQFGYVGYIDPQSGHLVCPTMTEDVWDKDKAAGRPAVIEEFGGLWGWVLENRKPLLINNVADDPRSTGTPLGHLPVRRFLSAPALVGEKIVGQIVLANAGRDYTDEDLSLVQRMATLYALAVQRTQAEEALQESEDRFRQLAENISKVFWIGAPDWNEIMYVSPAYETIWGRSCQSLYDDPHSWLEAVREEDRAQVLAALNRKVAGDLSEVEFPEYRIVRPDGTLRWILARAFPVVNEAGRVCRIAGIAEDITDRKRAEEALQREHDLLNRLMETSPVGITVVDRTGRISFANSRAEEILGLSEKEISGLSYNDRTWRITDYEGQPLPDEALPFSRVMTAGQPVYDVRHAIEWATGRRVLLSINAAPLFDRSGRVDSVISVIEDVTARVRAEQERRKQLEQELQSLDLLSAPPPTGVTAQMFGLPPMRQHLPDIFQKLVQQYEELLDLAVEQRLYKVEHHVSDSLRQIAGSLGALRAGPRDVVECHSQAVKQKMESIEPGRARLYVEESRLTILELMGYLTTYYRNHAMGAIYPETSPYGKRGAGYDD